MLDRRSGRWIIDTRRSLAAREAIDSLNIAASFKENVCNWFLLLDLHAYMYLGTLIVGKNMWYSCRLT